MIITPKFPEEKYRTVLIDPPWPVTHNQVDLPYTTMPISEIASIPMNQLTEKDAYVFLWTTNSMIDEALGLIKLWRLRYVTMITWCKNYGLGRPPYTATEHIIMVRRGNPPRPHMQEGEERLFNWFATNQKMKHSVKPEESYLLVEKVSQGPYLELFARKARSGWDGWGLEAPNSQSTES